ncbi:Uncharacterised protein [Yersinia frederiksenii]|nr:Uncharacterised protein [Yersinia frederiksenii]
MLSLAAFLYLEIYWFRAAKKVKSNLVYQRVRVVKREQTEI